MTCDYDFIMQQLKFKSFGLFCMGGQSYIWQMQKIELFLVEETINFWRFGAEII